MKWNQVVSRNVCAKKNAVMGGAQSKCDVSSIKSHNFPADKLRQCTFNADINRSKLFNRFSVVVVIVSICSQFEFVWVDFTWDFLACNWWMNKLALNKCGMHNCGYAICNLILWWTCVHQIWTNCNLNSLKLS